MASSTKLSVHLRVKMRMLSRETGIPKGAVTLKDPFTVTLMKLKMIVRRSHSIGQCHSLFNVSASMRVNSLLNSNVFLTLLAAFLEKGIFVRDKSLRVGGKIITNFCLPKTHGNN